MERGGLAAIDEAAALLLLLAIVEVMPALRPPTERFFLVALRLDVVSCHLHIE